MFVCSNRLADAGRSRTEVGVVLAAWAMAYIISNQVLARFVTSRNAAVMMTVSNLLFAATAGTFLLIDNVWAIYALMAVVAVASALLFLPFQIFMRSVEPDQNQGVVRSVAIYTLAWSSGFASGPFIAGFIYQGLGWQWCFAFTGLLGLLTAGGVQLLKYQAKYHDDEGVAGSEVARTQPISNAEDVNYYTMPDVVWLQWVVTGVGCLGIYALLALLPSVGVAFVIPKSQIGSIIAAIYFMQALTGFSLIRGKTWMFRPMPVAGFAIFGLMSMVGFGVSLLGVLDGLELFSVPLRTIGFYASAACYGVFSGSFFFGLVFHALIHPRRRARYVAINETVVGICGVAGPIMAGALADRFGFLTVPVVLIVMIAGIAILQLVVLKRVSGQ